MSNNSESLLTKAFKFGRWHYEHIKGTLGRKDRLIKVADVTIQNANEKDWIQGRGGQLLHKTKRVGKRHIRHLSKKKFVTRKEFNKLLRYFGRDQQGNNLFPQKMKTGYTNA